MEQQSASVLAATKHRLEEMIESGTPVRIVLDEILRTVESLTASGMMGSILILDDSGRRLRHGSAPSLPHAYNEAIDGIEIGPGVGSCGTAAYLDKMVSVFDIANDPLWANFKELALKHGLRACWSAPIRDANGNVIGTFANYYKVVRDPSPTDKTLTEMITQIAASAILHARTPAAAPVSAS